MASVRLDIQNFATKALIVHAPNREFAAIPKKRFRFQSFERITLDRDVDLARKEGERVADGWLEIYLRERKDGKPFRRLAVRVAKRAGNAPLRSRLRRLVREVFRHSKENLRPSLDLLAVIRPFQEAKKLKYGDLQKKWDRLTLRFQTRSSSL